MQLQPGLVEQQQRVAAFVVVGGAEDHEEREEPAEAAAPLVQVDLDIGVGRGVADQGVEVVAVQVEPHLERPVGPELADLAGDGGSRLVHRLTPHLRITAQDLLEHVIVDAGHLEEQSELEVALLELAFAHPALERAQVHLTVEVGHPVHEHEGRQVVDHEALAAAALARVARARARELAQVVDGRAGVIGEIGLGEDGRGVQVLDCGPQLGRPGGFVVHGLGGAGHHAAEGDLEGRLVGGFAQQARLELPGHVLGPLARRLVRFGLGKAHDGAAAVAAFDLDVGHRRGLGHDGRQICALLRREAPARHQDGQLILEVLAQAIGGEVAHPGEHGLEARRGQQAQRRQEIGLAALVAPDQGGGVRQVDPSTVVDVAEMRDPELLQPHVSLAPWR